MILKMKISQKRINWRITQTNFFCYLLLIFSVKTRGLDESDCKPNKIWVDKSSGFYNRSMKSTLEKNDTEMCSIHNEGKSVVAEGFIRIVKNKIYEYMTSILKNVYVNKSDVIRGKYTNTYQRTIKIKNSDVKKSMYIDFT